MPNCGWSAGPQGARAILHWQFNQVHATYPTNAKWRCYTTSGRFCVIFHVGGHNVCLYSYAAILAAFVFVTLSLGEYKHAVR